MVSLTREKFIIPSGLGVSQLAFWPLSGSIADQEDFKKELLNYHILPVSNHGYNKFHVQNGCSE